MDHGRRAAEQPAFSLERAPGPVAYRACRENVTELLGAHPDAADENVPACPDWTVRDLLAHVVEACQTRYEALGLGVNPPRAVQEHAVQEHAVQEHGVAELLAEWARLGPYVEQSLAGGIGFSYDVLIMDAFTHELDLRRVVDAPPPDDHPAFPTALGLLLNGFSASVYAHDLPALRMETEGAQWVAGRGNAVASVRAHHFDLYRSIAGRRTHQQIAELSWSSPAETWFPAFTWGPFNPPAKATEEVIGRAGAHH